MKRIKEIIVIISIIGITIFLAFIPVLTSKNNEVVETSTKPPSTIKINITGELKVNELNIRIPYGYSYGYIISKIELYLNDYSIIDDNKTKRYYEDTKIVIGSSDIKVEPTTREEPTNNTDKTNINTATKKALVNLTGIGDKRADKIIEYRETKKIESFEELRELLGVSEDVIEAIKEEAIL